MHYRSLAQKWSAQHNAVVMEEEESPKLICQELWIFCDGSDIESIVYHRNRIRADRIVLVSISISHRLLFALGSFDTVIEIYDEEQKPLWVQLIKAEKKTPAKDIKHNIFLSHAVADEAKWLPKLNGIRNILGHSIFSCSDSIALGGNWYEHIVDHLSRCDWMLCLITKSFASSTFCAFEVGMARAVQKPIFMISVDDSLPPSYAQDLHMETLSRYCATRPWLSKEDALCESILTFASRQIEEL